MSGNQLAKPARRTSRRQPLRINGPRRKRLEALAENIIALLDEIDPGPDDEENGDLEPSTGPSDYYDECEPEVDEPWLGWTEMEARSGRYGDDATSDKEQEHDGREPDEDREPSLGALENHPGISAFHLTRGDQSHWGSSETRDREPNGDEQDFSDHY